MLKKYTLIVVLVVAGSCAMSRTQTIDPATEQEINCLAQATYHEARGEPYHGRVAVAQVVLNRVRSGEFPDSVCRVVKQKSNGTCQFSWVCSKHVITQHTQFREDLQLATAVFYGMVEDVTKGATYFHNRSVKPKWANKFKLTARIGNHSFYRKRSNEQAI